MYVNVLIYFSGSDIIVGADSWIIRGLDKEFTESLDKEWHRFFNGHYKVSVRYCYLLYDAENDTVFEKECAYRDLSDAIRALKKRVNELERSGASCRPVSEKDFVDVPVYVCEVPLEQDYGVRVARIIGRIDISARGGEGCRRLSWLLSWFWFLHK